jgi:hypothetical protein
MRGVFVTFSRWPFSLNLHGEQTFPIDPKSEEVSIVLSAGDL